jgi:hypothetical protein
MVSISAVRERSRRDGGREHPGEIVFNSKAADLAVSQTELLHECVEPFGRTIT